MTNNSLFSHINNMPHHFMKVVRADEGHIRLLLFMKVPFFLLSSYFTFLFIVIIYT
jgi:hypothetical protein